MKLDRFLMAWTPYLLLAVFWEAPMLLALPLSAASLEKVPCEELIAPGSVSIQDSNCHTDGEEWTGPKEDGFQNKGYTFSEPFHLIVSYDWLILQGPSKPVFEGDSLVLRCRAWQDWPLTQVIFYRDSSALGPPGPNQEFTIPVVQEADSGHYHCSGIFRSPGSGIPETASSTAIVVQELFSTPVLSAAPSTEPQEGSPVTLSCQTKLPLQRSATRLLFSFYKDGKTLRSRDLFSEFRIPAVSSEHSGSYWCEATTEDNQVWKQSLQLEIRVHGFSSSAAPPISTSAPQKPTASETASTEPPGPLPPPTTPSPEDPCLSTPLVVPDPHLHYQMSILLKYVQDVRALLGHLVTEMRDLSGHQKPETMKTTVKQK